MCRLFDEHLLAVDDVDTFQFSAFTFHFSALQIVDGFHLSVLIIYVFRDPRGVTYATLRATCHYAYYRNCKLELLIVEWDCSNLITL